MGPKEIRDYVNRVFEHTNAVMVGNRSTVFESKMVRQLITPKLLYAVKERGNAFGEIEKLEDLTDRLAYKAALVAQVFGTRVFRVMCGSLSIGLSFKGLRTVYVNLIGACLVPEAERADYLDKLRWNFGRFIVSSGSLRTSQELDHVTLRTNKRIAIVSPDYLLLALTNIREYL